MISPDPMSASTKIVLPDLADGGSARAVPSGRSGRSWIVRPGTCTVTRMVFCVAAPCESTARTVTACSPGSPNPRSSGPMPDAVAPVVVSVQVTGSTPSSASTALASTFRARPPSGITSPYAGHVTVTTGGVFSHVPISYASFSEYRSCAVSSNESSPRNIRMKTPALALARQRGSFAGSPVKYTDASPPAPIPSTPYALRRSSARPVAPALTAWVSALPMDEPEVFTPPVWSRPSPMENRRPAWTSVRCQPP